MIHSTKMDQHGHFSAWDNPTIIIRKFFDEIGLHSGSLGGSTESEPTQMEMFNFLWLIWDHYLPLTPTRND